MDQKAEAGSEVAALLAHIQKTYESAVLGLSGLASGAAKHEFITARMERIGELHEELSQLVGEEQASMLLVQVCEHDIEWPTY